MSFYGDLSHCMCVWGGDVLLSIDLNREFLPVALSHDQYCRPVSKADTERGKKICTPISVVVNIKMQVVRARMLFAWANVSVLWPTALCVFRSRHYFSF